MSRSDRRIRWRLLWASLRWRAGASVVMLLVAAAAVAVGTLGPIYLQGADQSVLLATLRAAPVGNSGLTLLGATTQSSPIPLERAARILPRGAGGRALFGSPIATADLPVTTVARASGQPYRADLVSRTRVCEHLTFLSGQCPRTRGTVALSARSARELGLRVGDRVPLQLPGLQRTPDLRISGLYRPGDPSAPFWWGENDFGFGSGLATEPAVDDVFTSRPTLLGLAPAGQASFVVQMPLETAAVGGDSATALEQTVTRYQRRARALGVDVGTQVYRLLDQASTDERTSTTIVAVVEGQLVLLSLLILYFVAARTAEAREPDVRLAELRGFSRSGTAWVALLGPLALLIAALPVGVLAAWLAARAAAPHLFGGGVAPSIDPLAIEMALLTLAAGVVATVLGARRLIGPGSAAPGGGGGRATLAVAIDAVAVAFAAAAFIEVTVAGVSSGSRTDPLAALAPGLLAFGAGVLGARLLPWGTRATIPLTRDSTWVGTGLATRRVARRPELSRHIVVLALAIGLATFAVAGWAVAEHNRAVQSEFAVGAARVLDVQVRPGVDFLDAVRRVDPDGHQAMAAVVENASDGELLAVDSSRLAAVAAWPPGLSRHSVTRLSHQLAPRTAPPVVLPGRTLRVDADLTRVIAYPPQLQATVFDDAYQTTSTLDLGSMRPGPRSYQATTGGACAATCRLVDLALAWTPPGAGPAQSTTVPLVITSLSARSGDGAWTPLRAGLDDPARWQSSSGGVRLDRAALGLRVQAALDADGAPATFGPGDVPSELPAVVAGAGAEAGNQGGGVAAVGLDGATITVRPVARVSALPGVGSDVALVDLALAERLQSGPMTDASPEVWLASGAGKGILRRLAAEGVSTIAVRSAAAQEAYLSTTGVSSAYRLFILAAVAAAVLAVGSSAFAVAVSARRRTAELASLRAVGVAPASLRRSIVVEHCLVIGAGVVLGAGAGLIAATVALPSVPEFVAIAPGPPLEYALPLPAVGLMLLAVTAALGLTVAMAARVVVASATPENLGDPQ